MGYEFNEAAKSSAEEGLGHLFLPIGLGEHTLQEILETFGVIDEHGANFRKEAAGKEGSLVVFEVLNVGVGLRI